MIYFITIRGSEKIESWNIFNTNNFREGIMSQENNVTYVLGSIILKSCISAGSRKTRIAKKKENMSCQ